MRSARLLADFLASVRVNDDVSRHGPLLLRIFGLSRDEHCYPPCRWAVLAAGFAYKHSHFTPEFGRSFFPLLLSECPPLIDESGNGTRRCQTTQSSQNSGRRARALNFLPEFRLDRAKFRNFVRLFRLGAGKVGFPGRIRLPGQAWIWGSLRPGLAQTTAQRPARRVRRLSIGTRVSPSRFCRCRGPVAQAWP